MTLAASGFHALDYVFIVHRNRFSDNSYVLSAGTQHYLWTYVTHEASSLANQHCAANMSTLVHSIAVQHVYVYFGICCIAV